MVRGYEGGITPAYAGKSKSTFIGQSPAEDHPRVCGEKSKTKDTAAYTPGSPPHVRGKVIKNHMEVLMQRITPAYAGKSWAAHEKDDVTLDHPRVCGEKICGIWLKCRSLGSPPRMRGKGSRPVPALHSTGITPAYAGKSE